MKANRGRGGWLEMLTNDLSFEGRAGILEFEKTVLSLGGRCDIMRDI